MNPPRSQIRIIGRVLLCLAMLALLQGLSACTAVRLTYNNGEQLSWWWIDGYFDFTGEQTPRARQAIDRFFAWHRKTQLPAWAGLMQRAEGAVLGNVTPVALCAFEVDVRQALEPSLLQALDASAELLPSLGEAQLKAMERRFAKRNDEVRKDHLQADAQDRLDESVKRVLDRAERLYGSLDEPQLRVVRAGVAASPFNPELWLAERIRRQTDTLQTLRRLIAEKSDKDQRVAALRGLVERSERSPEPEYRSYQVRLGEFNCEFAAQIHNATTSAQRRRAQQTLVGWEQDFRDLSAQGRS